MKKSQIVLVSSLIIILITLLTLCVGTYVYLSKHSSTLAISEIDSNTSWKTYSSKDGKFTIDYPSNWTVDENPYIGEGYLQFCPPELTDKSQVATCKQKNSSPHMQDTYAPILFNPQANFEQGSITNPDYKIIGFDSVNKITYLLSINNQAFKTIFEKMVESFALHLQATRAVSEIEKFCQFATSSKTHNEYVDVSKKSLFDCSFTEGGLTYTIRYETKAIANNDLPYYVFSIIYNDMVINKFSTIDPPYNESHPRDIGGFLRPDTFNTANDYNNDGYKDISFILDAPADRKPDYEIYLYNPSTKTFNKSNSY